LSRPARKVTPPLTDHLFGNKHNQYANPLSTPMPPADEPLLFNLATDPGETTSVAAEHPELVESMGELLEQLLVRPLPSTATR